MERSKLIGRRVEVVRIIQADPAESCAFRYLGKVGTIRDVHGDAGYAVFVTFSSGGLHFRADELRYLNNKEVKL